MMECYTESAKRHISNNLLYRATMQLLIRYLLFRNGEVGGGCKKYGTDRY